MNMIEVNSNDIFAIGFDDITHTLQIEFSNKEIHAYNDVELIIFAEFLYSDSKMDFAKENIFGQYKSHRIN